MKLITMHDGNVLNADAITHIIREEHYTYVYFAGGTKLSYLETPEELVRIIEGAAGGPQEGRQKNDAAGAKDGQKPKASRADGISASGAKHQEALPEPESAHEKALPKPE